MLTEKQVKDSMTEQFNTGYNVGVNDAIDQLHRFAEAYESNAEAIEDGLPEAELRKPVQQELVRSFYARQAEILIAIGVIKDRLLD